MKRALFALLLAASVVAVAQEPRTKPADPKTAAGTKAEKKAKKAEAKAPAKAMAASTALLANKDSKTYHRADCKLGSRMKEAHKTSFASVAEADKAGYKACKVCKP